MRRRTSSTTQNVGTWVFAKRDAGSGYFRSNTENGRPSPTHVRRTVASLGNRADPRNGENSSRNSSTTVPHPTIESSLRNTSTYSITLTEAIIVEMQSELSDTGAATGKQSEPMREHLQLTYRRIEWENHVEGKMAADDWLKQ